MKLHRVYYYEIFTNQYTYFYCKKLPDAVNFARKMIKHYLQPKTLKIERVTTIRPVGNNIIKLLNNDSCLLEKQVLFNKILDHTDKSLDNL